MTEFREEEARMYGVRNTEARGIKLVEARTSRRGQVVSDEISILKTSVHRQGGKM